MKRMTIVIICTLNILIINAYSQSLIDQKNISFFSRKDQNNKNQIDLRTFENKKILSNNSISKVQTSSNNVLPDISNPSTLKTIFFNPQKQWGIICRKEWEIEKSIGLPIRFRLGTLEYVNHLEGK